MNIRTKVTLYSNGKYIKPGTVMEIDDTEAKAMISRNFAESAEEVAPQIQDPAPQIEDSDDDELEPTALANSAANDDLYEDEETEGEGEADEATRLAGQPVAEGIPGVVAPAVEPEKPTAQAPAKPKKKGK